MSVAKFSLLSTKLDSSILMDSLLSKLPSNKREMAREGKIALKLSS
jgi:hypothetical protein